MVNTTQIFIIILAGISVGVADALIKKVALADNFWSAFKNPAILAILLLYFIQIVLFLYVFIHKWNLGIVGILQMVFYSFTVLIFGLLFFNETISLIQGIGIILAISGVVLMGL